jgi:hypothetical protein
VVELAGTPILSIPLVLASTFVILGLLAILGRQSSKARDRGPSVRHQEARRRCHQEPAQICLRPNLA